MRFALLFMLLCSTAYAELSAPPPTIVDAALNQYVKSLYNEHNKLEITNVAPNGNRNGRYGQVVIYENGGVYNLWNCVSSPNGTSWTQIASSTTVVTSVAWGDITGSKVNQTDLAQPGVEVITSSVTWVKPATASIVEVRCVGGGGAGGGGNGGSGGGGGACNEKKFRASDLPANVAVGIGAGGTGVANADGNPGGNTTFGTYLTGYGGGGGAVGAAKITGGSGGGRLGAGLVGNAAASTLGGQPALTAGTIGFYGGGGGGVWLNSPGMAAEWGGGSGGSTVTGGALGKGGTSIYGGGGGGKGRDAGAGAEQEGGSSGTYIAVGGGGTVDAVGADGDGIFTCGGGGSGGGVGVDGWNGGLWGGGGGGSGTGATTGGSGGNGGCVIYTW